MLKSAVLEAFLSSGSASWSQVNRRFGEEYPHVLSFFDLILTIPATSAACERGFNHMKLIKSHQRSAMTEKTLCDCLMIRLEGESIKDFNPDAAKNNWFDVTIRRPGGSQSKEKRQKKQVNILSYRVKRFLMKLRSCKMLLLMWEMMRM